MLKNSTKIYVFKTFAVIIYSALQINGKNLKKQIVVLFFVLYYRKSVLLKVHNVLKNPQILQHKFLILLQQPQSARKERLSPIFVASERGLDASM